VARQSAAVGALSRARHIAYLEGTPLD